MPKLNQALAKATHEAESANRELVPEGIYVVSLRSVEVKEGKTSGQPYWLWTFEIPDDADEYAGKRFFLNTSLQENALWKMKEVFEAFGVKPNTDTDTLVGERIRLAISQRPIASGARQGEMSNQAETALPLEPGDDEDGEGDDPPF